MRFGSAWPGANFQLVDRNTEIARDIHLIALVSDKPGTLELCELSLAISTPEGIVIVVGCSHPGVEHIDETEKLNRELSGGVYIRGRVPHYAPSSLRCQD